VGTDTHGQTICFTLEDHKAFSQNLGHSSIKTTEMHYGSIPAERQGQLIQELGKRETADPMALSLARELMERLGGARK
jgi:hypothetical protein